VVTGFGQLEVGGSGYPEPSQNQVWFLELKPEPSFKQDLVLESEQEPKLNSRIKTGSDFLIVDFIGKMLYERCEDEFEQFVYEGKR
jgi:hypothetical protein